MNTEPEHIIHEDGYEYWLLNGELHRTNGPAEIWSDGTQYWWLNGVLHREDGPAVIFSEGDQYWWLNGKEYNFSDWLAALDADKKTKILLTLK